MKVLWPISTSNSGLETDDVHLTDWSKITRNSDHNSVPRRKTLHGTYNGLQLAYQVLGSYVI